MCYMLQPYMLHAATVCASRREQNQQLLAALRGEEDRDAQHKVRTTLYTRSRLPVLAHA